MKTIRTQYLVAAALGLALGVLFRTRRSEGARLDRGEHEGRLEKHFLARKEMNSETTQ